MYFLKKNFWVVSVLAVVVVSDLAARTANHVLEGRYLLRARGGALKVRPTAPAAVGKRVDQREDAVIARNIFCSSCAPDPSPLAGGTELASGGPPLTSLPLALLATSVSPDIELSSATVSNTTSARSGSYWLHDEIPGAGTIVAISPRYVDFENTAAKRVERLDLLRVARPAPPARTVDAGITKIDDTHFRIDRALVDRIIGDPSLLVGSARIVPSMGGRTDGVKLYAIRPDSLAARIGLENGDILHAIDGREITSPDQAIEVYEKLTSASSLSVQVTRRGQPVVIAYTIE